MRKINTRFFFVLVISLIVLAGAVFGLHRLQANNIAEALRWQANQAEKDGKLDRAAKYLGRYLEFAREDLDEREHLGMILSEPAVATTPQRRARARFVIEQVLAKDPQRHVLRQRLCQTLIASRQFELAKEHLTYLEKNQPASADGAYLLGQWHEAQNKSTPALDAYRRAIKLDAGNVDAYVRAVGLLKRLSFGNDAKPSEEIDRLVAAALTKAPQDPIVLSLAAQHAQDKGDIRAALEYLENGLKQNPAEPRLYLALARLHSQAGKRSEAIAKLKAGLEKVRKDQQYDLRWSLANHLLDDNRGDEAKQLIAQMREVNALSADYLDARVQMQRGRWFEAARQFERIRPALKASKEIALQLDLYLGACYEQLEEPALQLAAFQRAAELDATSLVARRGMASARWALGQTGEALAIYQDLAARTKDPDEAARRRIEYLRLALQSGQQRNPKELKRLGDDLTELEKTLVKSLDVALLRAELLYVQGEKAKAETLLEETIRQHPDRHEPWLALILAALGKNDATAARQLMDAAESRFKDKAAFRLAQIRIWAHQSDAEAYLQRIEADIPRFTPREQSTLLQTLAEAHFDAHRYADSGRVLNRLLNLPLHAQDVRIRMQILELALLRNDDALARSVLADVKRLEGDGGADGSLGEALRIIRVPANRNKDTLEKARHLLTVAAAQRPNWHPIAQARAELDELQGRPEQAIANYRRAVELGARDPLALRQLIVLLSQAHRHAEVEEVLARMQKQFGASDDVVRLQAVNSYQQRDLKKTEGLIKQILANDSANWRDHLWMGQILSMRGQAPAAAEKAFRRAQALTPQQPEVWIHLVRHLISVGQNVAAKTEIDNARKMLADERRDMTLAQCCELLGLLKDASEHHNAAIEKAPTSVPAHRAAADFYLRVGALVEAETLYRKIVERKFDARDEDVAAARQGLALALARQNRPSKSAEALQLVGLALDDKSLLRANTIAEARDEQLLQAKVLGSLNHHRLRLQAIGLLESLHQKAPLGADDQFMLAHLFSQNGLDADSWTKTKALLKSITLDNPRNPRYLAYAAHLHVQQKEYNEAETIIVRLEAVERERKTPPGGFGSIELRAKLMELRGLGSQAVSLLTSYAAQPEALPVRKLLIANMHGRLGNFREAIDLCEDVRMTPAHANEAYSAAITILRQNRPSDAQPTKQQQWQKERARVEAGLREAMQKDAKDVSARLHLADLLEMEGKHDEVVKLGREVLALNPNHVVALNNLAWLLGQKQDSAAEALTLIQRAIEQFGPRPELLDTRAVVQLNLGNVEPALRDLERVVNEAPTPTRLFHLSRAYEKSRNMPSALALLRQANAQGLTLEQLHPAERAEYQRVSAELTSRP